MDYRDLIGWIVTVQHQMSFTSSDGIGNQLRKWKWNRKQDAFWVLRQEKNRGRDTLVTFIQMPKAKFGNYKL
ncbi:hypothetical protein OUZ56_031461 [Daphnia magna]|uniref:Uncharacterized protein n=1 Tax=Daphnia magna TaxID=35525 RepID=A0ABQ9ZUA9_9CRUS|nr:hypothetical protein OUZ56_031461 [Daphnia magna]